MRTIIRLRSAGEKSALFKGHWVHTRFPGVRVVIDRRGKIIAGIDYSGARKDDNVWLAEGSQRG